MSVQKLLQRGSKRISLLLLAVALGAFAAAAIPAAAQAAFGVNDFNVTFTNENGTPDTQAGSHPYAMTTSFNSNFTGAGPEALLGGDIDNLIIEEIAGFVGNATAMPQCSSAEFLADSSGIPSCNYNDAVGLIGVSLNAPTFTVVVPVYNLKPPPGAVTTFGFDVLGVEITLNVGLKGEPEYDVIAPQHNLPQVFKVYSVKFQLWGDPESSAHDNYRGGCGIEIRQGENLMASEDEFEPNANSCPASAPDVPFLTLPTSCVGATATHFEASSWQEPDNWLSGSVAMPATTGCSRLGFSPTVTAQPTSVATDSPTGLYFSLDVHDEGLTSPTGLAQSDIRKAVVTLPEGMTANPSLADGLNVCTEAELARETAYSARGEGCPSESKIGTVEVQSPLIGEPLTGSLFMAKPYANPFDSLLAVYFVMRNSNLGIVIKQPAEIEPNPVTGQLVTVVEDIPQLPFTHFKLHFREGSRSPLVSPPACGTYDVQAELTPWSGGEPVMTTSKFQIISGADESACPSAGVPPLAPQVTAGTLNNAAGTFSPFDLTIARADGEQELTRFSTLFPPGLTGSLTGIPFCPDADIEAARSLTGTQELEHPSCPVESEIGHTLVGAGVGGVLAYTPGKVYLAGPYHGAPFSVVSITSAVVGPFDLGTVVIRFALRINPVTAQVEIDSKGSDPIPHIIDGIVVHVREIHAYIDREKFILNPTGCDPMSILDTVGGAGANFADPADEDQVSVPSRFQAADCENLAFDPGFKAAATARHSRKGGEQLHVAVTSSLGHADIAKVHVELPKALPSRLGTLQQACTETQFAANPAGCPAGSVVGNVTVDTPVLPVPLTGPAYFVSRGAQWPELTLVLQGYGVTIELAGETFISKKGITSTTFKSVPDVPFSRFELTLPKGPHSALAANGDLCKKKLVMPTKITAQNGAVVKQRTKVEVTGCAAQRKKHKAAHRKASKHKHKRKRGRGKKGAVKGSSGA